MAGRCGFGDKDLLPGVLHEDLLPIVLHKDLLLEDLLLPDPGVRQNEYI
jgi:hypothetical protein